VPAPRAAGERAWAPCFDGARASRHTLTFPPSSIAGSVPQDASASAQQQQQHVAGRPTAEAAAAAEAALAAARGAQTRRPLRPPAAEAALVSERSRADSAVSKVTVLRAELLKLARDAGARAGGGGGVGRGRVCVPRTVGSLE